MVHTCMLYTLWSRDDISCCRCSDLKSLHVHCPCDSCCGKAVARATEYRHWVATRDYLQLTKPPADNSTFESHSVDENGENNAANLIEVGQEVYIRSYK